MFTSTETIREIVSTQPTSAAVLERYGIDSCSQADMPFEKACAEVQLSVEQVLERLSDAEASEPGASPVNPAGLSTVPLIRHIVRVHHQSVRRELPRLLEMAQRLFDKRSDRRPELKRVKDFVEDLYMDLSAHIQKEEQILFPLISQMSQEAPLPSSSGHACFDTVAQPIAMMMEEHNSADRTMAELRRLTLGFEPAAWACVTHVALYAGLRTFDTNLRQHMHPENDILFPRALEMEAGLILRG